MSNDPQRPASEAQAPAATPDGEPPSPEPGSVTETPKRQAPADGSEFKVDG
jgi:hypothetical protein